MNILFLIDSLELGGAQILLKNYFENQQDNKNIHLFVLRSTERMIEITHPNVSIFNSYSKISLLPINEIIQIISKNNISIVHCHLFRSQSFAWLIKLFFKREIKIIFHEHGEILFHYSILYRPQLILSKYITDKYIAVSQATKNALIQQINIKTEKIEVIPNFVNSDKYLDLNTQETRILKRTNLNITENEFVIGYVGRLSEVKGCNILIQAVKQLTIKYKLIIVGDGEDKEKLENLTKNLDLKDNIKFLGAIAEVETIYPVFDIVVIPSISEAFSLVTIEAQISGVPIIGSNIPALSEIITDEDNGLLFTVNDVDILAKKIEYLFHNQELRKKIIKNGKEKAKQYNYQNFVNNLNRIYNEM